jgi:ribosomal-protein-alanine N-acetyltransferase
MSRSSPDFRIATADRKDAARIAAAHARLFAEPWDQKSIAGLLGNSATLALVSTPAEGNGIAGFVIAHVAADEAEVLSIGVTPDWQRRGLGERLLRELGKAAAARGAKQLYVDVAEDNAAALALYSRLGFAATARRKGYYARQTAPPSDALLLARAL